MRKKTKVVFTLPGRGTYPVGGFRVVYEYANRLSNLGIDVCVVHIAWLYKSHSFWIGLGRYIYCLLFYRFYKKWFDLHPDVDNKWVFIANASFMPNADYIIATSWETAENVVDLPSSKGEKLYLIQGNESEFHFVRKNNLEDRVLDTWNFPMQKIVISSWLKDKVNETGNNAVRIFNGLNFEEFYIENEIIGRDNNIIMMLYHESPAKGCEEGLIALRKVKTQVHDLKVILFGVPQPPEELETWIEYHRMPSRSELRGLYNRCSIFLSPSHSEGWGLPVAEAMQCGAAVLTTDIGGFRDFVIDNETGLCFQVRNIEDMCKKLILLLENQNLRTSLASRGNAFVRKFSWDNAAGNMLNLLKSKE